MAAPRKKSYQARKNEGNDLFFRILRTIMATKSHQLYAEHLSDPTFDDVYTLVGVEKALSKCNDVSFVVALSEVQSDYSKIDEHSLPFGNFKALHYYYLMNALPKTFQSIDWRLDTV